MHMRLPLGFGLIDFGSFDVSDWLRGLISAFIVGGSSAVTSGFVVSIKDPVHYAPGTLDWLELVGSVFLMSGLMGAMAFLRSKPLPDLKQREQTVEVTSQKGKPPVVVSTTKDTSLVAADAPIPPTPTVPPAA